MGQYGEQVAATPLFTLLKSKGKRKKGNTAAMKPSDVDKLAGMVLEAADIAGPLLANIPVTFRQYTTHDIAHSINLIELMGRFIPAKTQQAMTAVEVAVLMLSAILHDLGMYVEPAEKDEVLASFPSFLRAPETERAIVAATAANQPGTVRAIEDAALAEYFRKRHPHRAGLNIDRYLPGKLLFNEIDLAPWVKKICESHGWPVYESNDPAHPDHAIKRALKPYDPLYGIAFHPQYIACCLRLADIMDFDRSRTPLALLRTITDEKSQSEWQKHLQITGWEINEHDVEFHASCTHPEHYVAVMEFLDAVDRELLECRRMIVRDATKPTEDYTLHLPAATDRIHVGMKDPSYIAGGFKFELEYERILKLLMDKSLYPDPSLFLRELLQNSLDACRLRKALIEEEGTGAHYRPHIVVWDHSEDANDPRVVFQDNGIGMSEEVVKNYFMRVGRSYYRSGDFNAQRERLQQKGIALEATSQFGIGFLSCFMVADRIDIETYRKGETPLHIGIEGPAKYFVVRRLARPTGGQLDVLPESPENDGPPQYAGTRITAHLRPGVTLDVAQVIETFAVNVEADIVVRKGGERRVVEAFRWERGPVGAPDLYLYGTKQEESGVAFTQVEVPLASFDFCDGLRGRAWFWFLRDEDGMPCPRLGHLFVADELECGGPPRFFSDLSNEKPFREARGGRVSADYLDSNAQAHWNAISVKQRRSLLNWMHLARSSFAAWALDQTAIEALARGDDSWTALPYKFDTGLEISATESLALHGIRVPAAVTAWDPMNGSSSRVRLFRFAAGYLVDDRRPNAATPAANRLFVDPQEGEKTLLPLARAFLRTAVDLVLKHGETPDWEGWFGKFVTRFNADLLSRAAAIDAPVLRQFLKIPVYEPGAGTNLMTADELRQEFGRYIPVYSYRHDHRVISEHAWQVRLAFADKQRLERDGSRVIDLDSTVD